MAIGNIRFVKQGASADVVLDGDGKQVVLLDTPWQALEKIGLAFLQAAKECEEYAKANEIISDQAILFRSGAPIALSANPKILDEAKKEAVWNRDLRRSNLAMAPGGIPSAEQVGVPSVTLAEPHREPQPLIIPGK